MVIITLYLCFGPCTEVHQNGYWKRCAAKITKRLKLLFVRDCLDGLALYDDIATGQFSAQSLLVDIFRKLTNDYSAALFYALCAILRDSDFRHGQALSPVGDGAEVMGAADELARKAVSITSAS